MAQTPLSADLQPARQASAGPEPGPNLPAAGRRLALPLFLFAATCLSTFWTGATGEYCAAFLDGGEGLARTVVERFQWGHGLRDGLMYMGAVIGILLAHEMGHFVLACYHGVPASYPYFIPMPIFPVGTMGAVIAMKGNQADRRQLFDLAIAGPLAGLVVAVPVLILGIRQASPQYVPEMLEFHQPLLMQWLVAALRPELAGVPIQMNSLLLAGWVGLFITGLNMLPVSQLDGGHISYALLGRKAHFLAHGLVFSALLYILITQNHGWIVMLLLVMLIGVSHPPTADDNAPLGWARRILGFVSMSIPILCFPPRGVTM